MSSYTIHGWESVDTIERMLYASEEIKEVYLSKRAVLALIDRFLGSSMSGADLEKIAEMLDANESLAMDDEDRTSITTAIFQMSSSEINGALTKERIESVKEDLLK